MQVRSSEFIGMFIILNNSQVALKRKPIEYRTLWKGLPKTYSINPNPGEVISVNDDKLIYAVDLGKLFWDS